MIDGVRDTTKIMFSKYDFKFSIEVFMVTCNLAFAMFIQKKKKPLNVCNNNCVFKT